MAKGPSRGQLIELIHNVSEPVVSRFGLQIWGIELYGGGRTVVRLFLDSADSANSPAIGKLPEKDEQGRVLPNIGPPIGTDIGPNFEDAELTFSSQGGVTVNQCAEISRLVGLALEVEDAFPGAWTLEVSSPGLERTFFRLEQMNRYIGETIEVILWNPLPDVPLRKKYRGIVSEVGAGAFSLELSEASPDSPPQVRIRWDDVRKAGLIHVFPDTNKPGTGK